MSCFVLFFVVVFCYCHLKSKRARAHTCICAERMWLCPHPQVSLMLYCSVLFCSSALEWAAHICVGDFVSDSCWLLLTLSFSRRDPPNLTACTPLPSLWVASKCVTHTPHHLNRASEFPSAQRHLSHGVFSGKRKPSRTTALKIARAQPFIHVFKLSSWLRKDRRTVLSSVPRPISILCSWPGCEIQMKMLLGEILPHVRVSCSEGKKTYLAADVFLKGPSFAFYLPACFMGHQ